MNKANYLADGDVQNFVVWLAGQLDAIPIKLNIPRSKFVPTAVVNVQITGLTNVIPSHYHWKAKGAPSGTWKATNVRLARLANMLRQAVAKGDDVRAFRACCSILNWGGDRNSANGATPFLRDMGSGLCAYIKNAGVALSLSTATLAAPKSPVNRMNSMLTKIHALYSTDGLPIYDSRVAAAIATLVEMWRRSTGAPLKATPRLLIFPATLSTRSVKQKYPDAASPGTFSYDKKYVTTTTNRWTEAKVRLGWLMSEVLSKNQAAFDGPSASLASRMRSMEASLFMVGYDVACL